MATRAFRLSRVGLLGGLLAMIGAAAAAEDLRPGGKLLLTRGVTQVEGAGGGGLAAWALITGNETRDGVGASAVATVAELPDYRLTVVGAALGVFDRVELSYARQSLDTREVGAALGLGEGFTFNQDIYGAKLRVLGDAVYDQDRWMPQVAVGVQHKRNDRGAIVSAVGGRADSGTDVYVAATKVLLAQSLLLNATLRSTEANQLGLLGFGGDREDDRTLQLEASAAMLLSRRVLVGAEYRSKPDNLGFAAEDDWFDLFAAVAVNEHLSLVAAYVDAGSIATIDDQRGVYLSLQAGF